MIGHGMSINIQKMIVFETAFPNDLSNQHQIKRSPEKYTNTDLLRFKSSIFPNDLKKANPEN